MSEYFVIVESPAKAKTIKKFLGRRYSVAASMGHLRDLPKSQLGIDIENDFTPKYITIRGKGELLAKLKKEAKGAKKVLLATDPDREGEAISWHLAQAIGIGAEEKCRVSFNEITKPAILAAVKSPQRIDQDLVDSQQARRALDRIVGYKISPLLWAKVKKGLSAGRVQSVALRMVVDRAREIDEFIPREYWSITARLSDGKTQFNASYHGVGAKKNAPANKAEADEILKNLAGAKFTVLSVKYSEKQKAPAPPFITSTLQQEASRRLGFNPRRTMGAAQALYEGVEVPGRGVVGLITYMRTDSLNISNEARENAAAYIKENFGAEYLPQKPRVYKSRKGAQDAHEAIRPTDAAISPQDIKGVVKPDLYRLYKLIWERFLASQMASAVYDAVRADITAADYLFKASGEKIKFKGYEVLYIEGQDGAPGDEQAVIPALKAGMEPELLALTPKQHFTEPPPRYTEAALIRAMEEKGIGRPSTYAPTITTILARGYVIREKKTLEPTELGYVVTDIMVEHFPEIVDAKFTAGMEEKLDSIEDGSADWVQIIREFYEPFSKVLEKAEENIGKIEVSDEVSDIACEKCGRMMVYKMGRFGKFLACPGFPECRNAKPIVEQTNIPCPLCGGSIIGKKSRKGKKYYTCDREGCELLLWDEPVDKLCELCGSQKVVRRLKAGDREFCSNKECPNAKAR